MLVKLRTSKLYENIKDSIADLSKAVLSRETVIIFALGIIIHFCALSNLIYNHDSITSYSNDLDWLVVQGKWFVTPLASLDGPSINLNTMQNMIGLMAYAVASQVFCTIFSLNDRKRRLLVGAVFVAFPSVATSSLYHVLDYFALAFLIAFLGAYFIAKRDHKLQAIGIIILTFSVGGYQAYLGVALAILVLLNILDLLKGAEVKGVLKRGFGHFLCCIISTLIYYIILKIELFIQQKELNDYKGISSMTDNIAPSVLLKSSYGAIKDVYRFLLKGALSTQKYLFAACTVLTGLLICIYIYRFLKAIKNKGENIIARGLLVFILLLICLPLSANVIGALSRNATFYYISIAPFLIMFTLPVLLNDLYSTMNCEESISDESNNRKRQALGIFANILVFMFCWIWAVQDNSFYEQQLLITEQITSKVAILATEIQQTEGYEFESNVYFLGEPPYTFLNSTGISESMDILFETTGAGYENMQKEVYHEVILWYYLKNQLSIYFNIQVEDDAFLDKYASEIEEMSVYPDNGSIINVDGNILVKLAE